MKNLSISRYKINISSRLLLLQKHLNYNWSLKHTLNLIKKIKEAGAHAVKIQTYNENMTFNSKTLFLQKRNMKNIF